MYNNQRCCMLLYGYFPEDPRVRKEVNTLRSRGVAVDILCLNSGNEAPVDTTPQGNVYRMPLRVRRGSAVRYVMQYVSFTMMAALRLLRLHYRYRYRIIHVHSLPDFAVFCAALPKLMGARVVLDLHEAMPEIAAARLKLSAQSRWYRLLGWVERQCMRFAHEVITVNDTIRARLLRHGGLPSRVTVIMNSPETEANVSAPPRKSSRYRLVYAGGINPERDLETVFRAVARAAKTLPQIHADIYGEASTPEYNTAMRTFISAEGLERHVTLHGKIHYSEVPARIRAANLGIVSYADNPLTRICMPNKVFEYIQQRLPVILPDLPTLRETVADGGLYYRAGDAEDFAQQVVDFFTKQHGTKHERLMLEHGQAALQRCRWPVMAERLAEIYRRCGVDVS